MKTNLHEGLVRSRPPKKRSQAFSGVHPLSPLIHRSQKFQPLPFPIGDPPYHYYLKSAIPDLDELIKASNKLVFHTVGDVGGIKHPEYQEAVAAEMKRDLYNMSDFDKPLFFYLLGDVVYYNGEHNEYYPQFYEPYNHYEAPILAIAGNHDGDPIDSNATSLDGWIKYFMTETPHVDVESRDAPRVTLSIPNVYYTIITPFATFVGLYTNVPEHGSIDSQQQQWVTNEFATADKDKALIVALHHPIYSFDDHHSGSPIMADVIQHAINDSRRIPNLILTAHVHNYQRIEKNILEDTPTPFFVAGNGGYYHLHNLTAENGFVDDQTGATLMFGNDKQHGYMTITVGAQNIEGYATLIDKDEKVTKQADTFSYSAKAQYLPDGLTISL